MLREWIQRRDITKVAAAFELGFTAQYMSQLLVGVRRPSRELALRIQGIAGIGVGEWDVKAVSKRDEELSVAKKSARRPRQ